MELFPRTVFPDSCEETRGEWQAVTAYGAGRVRETLERLATPVFSCRMAYATTREELDGSAWSEVIHGHLGGRPPVVALDGEKRLAGLLQAARDEWLISSAHDLSEGGLGQALAEGVLRFGVGARVWLTEIMSRDGVDAATALFSESTGRVIVTVPREEDVKFRGLCEGRGYPVARIGVTDSEPALEVQDVFTVTAAELRELSTATLPSRFGPTVVEPVA